MTKQKMPPSLEDFVIRNGVSLRSLSEDAAQALRDFFPKSNYKEYVGDDVGYMLTNKSKNYDGCLDNWSEIRRQGAALSLSPGLSIYIIMLPVKDNRHLAFSLDESTIYCGDGITPDQQSKLIKELKQYIRRKKIKQK